MIVVRVYFLDFYVNDKAMIGNPYKPDIDDWYHTYYEFTKIILSLPIPSDLLKIHGPGYDSYNSVI